MINYWPMVLHRIVINIKLPFYLLTLLVPTKKKRQKTEKCQNRLQENKKFEHQK